MDYFRMLDLNREPFSNSPDPELFFAAPQYADCLQHLELAVRLRRGLNVVIGEIGIGKSTLCRQLILRLSTQQEDKQEIETHLIMDPAFEVPREFLSTVAVSLGLPASDVRESDWQIKEQIKHILFRKGFDEKKIVVLLIDEGQKLPDFCFELLREFLNYETNQYKLLQIIIFAQPEFARMLKEHANFADRINHHGILRPMSSKSTAEMIRYRIMKTASGVPPVLFTPWGLRAIHRATGGYPRKVITLCHQLILAMIIRERAKAGWFLVHSNLQKNLPGRTPKGKRVVIAAVALAVLFVSLIFLDDLWQRYPEEWQIKPEAMMSAKVATLHADAVPMMATPFAPPLPPEGTDQAAAAPEKQAEALPGTAVPPRDSDVPPEPSRVVTSPSPVTPPVKPLSPLAMQTPAEATRPPVAGKQVIGLREEAPKMLGQLTIRKDGSVLRMMKKIYGSEDPAHLKAVARANPQIDNINLVAAGRTVNFPAIPVSWKSPSQKTYRLRIARKSELKDAYGYIEGYSTDLPAARLVPYWSSREGLVFAVLLKEGFTDQAAAIRTKTQLPPSLAADTDIVEAWDEDIVFFAYPQAS